MPPLGEFQWSRTTAYGPATNAVMYVDIRGVVAKRVTARPSPSGSASPAGSFETTSQPCGAVTANENVALRSGWSKQANPRLASAGSNCV